MGLPIVISPVYSRNLAWLVLSPLLGPLLLKLPFGLGSWVRYNRFMWVLEEKASAFLEMGKMFVVVTPAKLQVRHVRGFDKWWNMTDRKLGVFGRS